MHQRLSASQALVEGTLRGPTTVEWTNGLITAVRDASADDDVVEGVLAPGFIDAQVNGVGPDRVSDRRCDWDRLSSRLRSQGVTSWMPTIPSQPAEFYTSELKRIQERMNEVERQLPEPLGLHLEGPILGRRPGAHSHGLFDVEASLIDVMCQSRMITVSPEHPLSTVAIERFIDSGITVSIGHTAADYSDYEDAVRKGVRHATHLFNAMTGVDHVDPGVSAFVLTDERVTFSMIADLRHVHPMVLRLAWQCAKARMSIVSDQVSSDASADLRPDARLQGAAVGLDDAVRNLVRYCKVPLPDVLGMISERPAQILGLSDRGKIREGYRADLVLLNKDLEVRTVSCSGFLWTSGGN